VPYIGTHQLISVVKLMNQHFLSDSDLISSGDYKTWNMEWNME